MTPWKRPANSNSWISTTSIPRATTTPRTPARWAAARMASSGTATPAGSTAPTTALEPASATAPTTASVLGPRMDSAGVRTAPSMRGSAAPMATTTSPFRMGMTPGATPSVASATPTLGMAAGPDTVRAGAMTPGAVASGALPTSATGTVATTPTMATSAPMAIPTGVVSAVPATSSTAPTLPHPVPVRASVNFQVHPW